MADGRIFEEPDCDWGRLPTKGRRRLRLVCPNGQIAELEANSDGPGGMGRFLQFKSAVVGTGSGRHTIAHTIGRIDGTDGQCRCYAWDWSLNNGKGGLITFEDNAYNMQWQHSGMLSSENLGMVAP